MLMSTQVLICFVHLIELPCTKPGIPLVDRPATQKFSFNKPANNMDSFAQKPIIWVLNDSSGHVVETDQGTICQTNHPK